MEYAVPTEESARIIASDDLGQSVISINRFATGKDNYVFDVETDREQLVIRMNTRGRSDTFKGALYWYGLLQPRQIPLPTVKSSDAEGKKYGFPYIVMERLPGTDLVEVYRELTLGQKQTLAENIVSVQNTVGELPPGNGYGYAISYDDENLYPSWRGVMDRYMKRIMTRNEKTSLIENRYIQRLGELYDQFDDYIQAIEPRPFLDDITTKNVIINDGKLSGIVDVDYVCFGDPLLVPALTHMSLLAMKADTVYTDYWKSLLDLSDEQQNAMNMYSGMFALEFASIMGHVFNREEAEEIDREYLSHLLSLFDTVTKNL